MSEAAIPEAEILGNRAPPAGPEALGQQPVGLT